MALASHEFHVRRPSPGDQGPPIELGVRGGFYGSNVLRSGTVVYFQTYQHACCGNGAIQETLVGMDHVGRTIRSYVTSPATVKEW